MMGFILSKLNLLILATALFGIIVFFTFSLNSTFVVQKANDTADLISSQVTALISSPAYCAKNLIIIPSELTFLGGERAFYVLEVSKVDLGNSITALKFTLLDRKNRKKVLASTRVNTNALIQIYGFSDLSSAAVDPNNVLDSVIIDPQAVTPIDGFVLAKEIYKGETYVFVVPCTTKLTSNNCVDNANDVVNAILDGRQLPQNDEEKAKVCLYYG